ncbi:signal peptidase I [Idiomarina xiamenensis]|uniref:Signal peptidase I n=1 Tax=Idiomarina xiamenensis 10-D-4 TaxID=740709 RepID=K2JMQ1_9GAMM|nr:signal peptidase I [Idiomarina xiamenensis]EKE84806.1 Signal peptidase I [Idiomarina xiamenensis 10-D-4]
MANYFSVILTLVTILTGVMWLYDARVLKPKRQARIASVEEKSGSTLSEEQRQQVAPQPTAFEYAQSIFPVIAAVLIFRSFLYEPFQIPSGSMMPTLLRGDFILVEKFSYDIKDPLFRSTLVNTEGPQRGDIAVFKYPPNPQLDYIKRVVGLPGDRIIYRNKNLYITPACDKADSTRCPPMQVMAMEFEQESPYFDGPQPYQAYREKLGEVSHQVLINPRRPSDYARYFRQPGTQNDEFIVPEGHYFMMGDNRDNSQDSRYWGFVPEENLVGRAVFIWMSFDMDRSADSWLPQWLPTGVRWSRLGTIGDDGAHSESGANR